MNTSSPPRIARAAAVSTQGTRMLGTEAGTPQRVRWATPLSFQVSAPVSASTSRQAANSNTCQQQQSRIIRALRSARVRHHSSVARRSRVGRERVPAMQWNVRGGREKRMEFTTTYHQNKYHAMGWNTRMEYRREYSRITRRQMREWIQHVVENIEITTMKIS